MLLNADIVFDNLPPDFKAVMTGPKTIGLALRRPELYEGGSAPFEADRLYLVNAERVPQQTTAGRGSVIVSIGDSVRLERYRKRCCVITLDRSTDFYRAFNVIQGIFDLYDEWVDNLQSVIDEEGDVSRLLSLSERVFGNPLYAIDGEFRILGASSTAASLESDPTTSPSKDGLLRLGAFDRFLELHDLSMDVREPLVLTLLDQTTLNYNLFDSDAYQGCLTVHYTSRPYRPSDKPLIEVLAHYVLDAVRQLASSAPEGPGSLRQAVQGLVEERPLDAIERDVIDAANEGRRFVCMRLKLSNQLEQLPLGYVRNSVENSFPRSIVFEYHRNSIVAVIDVDTLDEDDTRRALAQGIESFTGTMEMKAGFSGPYDDLVNTRAMFRQADDALDIGMLFAPSESVYFSDDFALRGMVMNAVGDMRLELLFPEGLKRLVEHDAASSTSYIETLRVYLENNLGVAKTAAQLYVHRSTLMERLSRIRRELALNLDDPDEQLRLRLLLKAMQIRDELRMAQRG